MKSDQPTVTLLQGECLDLMAQMPPQSVDAIICDPPYGTVTCPWDVVIPFDAMWAALKRVTRPDAAIVLHCVDPFASMLNASNIKHFKQTLIWVKNFPTDFLNSRLRHRAVHENVSLFSYGSPPYHPQMKKGLPFKGRKNGRMIGSIYNEKTPEVHYANETGDRYPATCLEFNREMGEHPTQKPLPLMEYLVRTYTDPGHVVLDFTMGSGTTGVACVRTGRSFIGIEQDPVHYATACRRIAHAQDAISLSLFGQETASLFERHVTHPLFDEEEVGASAQTRPPVLGREQPH